MPVKKYFTEEERAAARRGYRERYRADGRRSLEKEREYAKKARSKPGARERRAAAAKAAVLAQYGLTMDVYLGILKFQGGGCAGCGSPPSGRRLDVDHEHVKNYKKMPREKRLCFVRMLLCHRCNRALGLLGNEPVALTKTLKRLADSMEMYVSRRNGLLSLGADEYLRRVEAAADYLKDWESKIQS